MTICNNCSQPISDKFCGNCGEAAQLKRIDGRYVRHEIEHILHLEKGIGYTVKALFMHPGASVRTFISQNRSRLVKPIIFIIITSLIYSVISHAVHIDKTDKVIEKINLPATKFLLDWVNHHMGYANILMGISIALWLKLFFNKSGYNFFEILILLCFIMGIGMLLLSVFSLVEAFFHLQVTEISKVAIFIYCAWAIGQFFNPRKIGSYLKALAAYTLGAFVFYFILTFAGLMIDMLILR